MKKGIVKTLRKWHLIPGEKQNLFFTKDFLRGRGFQIGDYTYGNPLIMHWGEKASLTIGKFCSIAEGVKIFMGGNHQIHWKSTYPFGVLPKYFPEAVGIMGHPATKGDVIIGNDVWIGHGATIMSGVTIADGAVVAAEALVTKNIGPYEIWGGNPARFIKKRFSDNIIDQLLEEQWWNKPVEEIKKLIPTLCSQPI